MKASKYDITETQRIHISDKWWDEQGNLTRIVNHADADITETRYEYNEIGLLVAEYNYCDDKELDVTRYSYDKEENVLEQALYIGGELYELTRNIHGINSLETILEQDGKAVERSIRIESGDDHVIRFYENGELIEKQMYIYNAETRSGEKRIYDGSDNLFLTELVQFNEYDEMTDFKQLSSEGHLITHEVYVYDAKQLISSEYRNYKEESTTEYKVEYSYNAIGHLLREEVQTLEGNLIGFSQVQYDHKNRVTDEIEFYHANFNAIYGTYANGSNTHFQYEYHD